MKRLLILCVGIVVALLLVFVYVPLESKRVRDITYSQEVEKAQLNPSTHVKIDTESGKIPLYFIPNKGQVDETARFYAKTSRYTLWLTKEGLVFDSVHTPPFGHPSQEGITERDVCRLIFLDANANPEMLPVEMTGHRVNYFKGNDPAKWQKGILTSKAVLYKNIYKNIDLKVYGIEKQIEYDWVVKPGGNPRDIRFEYKNVKGTRLDDDGNLLIETEFGELIHKKPVCYQKINSARNQRRGLIHQTRVDVNGLFKKIGKNTYGFEVGEYDKNCELIIDPVVLAYSTCLGGSSQEWGFGIAVDSSGYLYVTGFVLSIDFPTRHEYQENQEGYDAFVSKIDATRTGASSLIYSTYLGGGGDDYGGGIAVDNSGNAYVIGTTESSDFPILDTYRGYGGGYDVFVVKIDTTGTGASSLTYSTYLGGGGDDRGGGIAVDNQGYVYVIGTTESPDFPTRHRYQSFQGGDSDVFVSKIDTTSTGTLSLLYSTFLGGKDEDRGAEIAVDSSGYAYITGETFSIDFPKRNQYQSFRGICDAFVTKIDTTRTGISSLVYSTYLGGESNDRGYGIAVDNSGNAYVTGETYSTGFPTLNHYQAAQGGYSDTFVTKIDTTRAGNSCLVYSTYLGGADYDGGSAIAIDGSGSAYVTGVTYSKNFPTRDQYQTFQGGYGDAFAAKIGITQSGTLSLFYSTYLGGSNADSGEGIAVDSIGNAYVFGNTYSRNFPTVNQYQTYQSGEDVFVTKILNYSRPPHIELNRTRLNFAAVIGGFQTEPQTCVISNSGGGSLNWAASASHSWIQVSPLEGGANTTVTVSVDAAGLNEGSYTGTITVTDPYADNSPVAIDVYLEVKGKPLELPPFGSFDTPVDGSIVMSSIPVSGWALDDLGVRSVKIFRQDGSDLIYIGDAVFVEGARPDVELAYPTYPKSFQAGWGYMMLTNFLPDSGNGTFVIHAVAEDIEGNKVTLGTKAIICDNAHAVRPFGALDTPAQGGTASGSSYINFGWALTPQPNTIPTSGSTIFVWIDGVNLGNPVYNNYRSDIATLFPGYANSDGAVGYFFIDTTRYANGAHTIQWTALDSAGNVDGIGSRYFSIQNTGENTALEKLNVQRAYPMHNLGIVDIAQIPVDYYRPIRVNKGYQENIKSEIIYPDKTGTGTVQIEELERVVIYLAGLPGRGGKGFQLVGDRLSPLPIGSTLDRERGIFYWQPGPGFIGSYRLVFIEEKSNGKRVKKFVNVKIVPRFLEKEK